MFSTTSPVQEQIYFDALLVLQSGLCHFPDCFSELPGLDEVLPFMRKLP